MIDPQDLKYHMKIEQLNGFYACSTLALSQFGYFDKEYLRELLIYRFTEEKDKRIPCKTSYRGGNYKKTDYGFVFASTESNQFGAEELLRELGFMESKRIKKKKNSFTRVKIWMLDMPTFLKNLGIPTEGTGLKILED